MRNTVFLCVHIKSLHDEGLVSRSSGGGQQDVWDISVLDASICGQFNVHINKSYRGPCRRVATFMQKTVLLSEKQQRNERASLFTGVRNTLQSAVHSMD